MAAAEISPGDPRRENMQKRTKEFAVRVARLVMTIPEGREADVIVRQLFRSSTSVGANYRAACHARSRADFVSKIGIAEEEADETQYWLEILLELSLIDEKTFGELHREARELTAILVTSGQTAKRGLTKTPVTVK